MPFTTPKAPHRVTTLQTVWTSFPRHKITCRSTTVKKQINNSYHLWFQTVSTWRKNNRSNVTECKWFTWRVPSRLPESEQLTRGTLRDSSNFQHAISTLHQPTYTFQLHQSPLTFSLPALTCTYLHYSVNEGKTGCHQCYLALQKITTIICIRFNGHFPGGPELAGTRMIPFWIFWT